MPARRHRVGNDWGRETRHKPISRVRRAWVHRYTQEILIGLLVAMVAAGVGYLLTLG